MAKLTISDKVKAALNDLQTLDRAGLTAWAKAQGMDSRAGFSSFKKALSAAGIDYDAMGAASRAAKTAVLEAEAAVSLTLFSDAKAKNDRFGICDRAGQPVWYGKFFSDDRDYNGEQSSGEMAAAKKAVWLSSKIKETLNVQAIALTLKVDAEWLCHANTVRNGGEGGGKARALGEMAQRLGVVLTVEHIRGRENPADAYTICVGFKKWQDTPLASLVDDNQQPISSADPEQLPPTEMDAPMP